MVQWCGFCGFDHADGASKSILKKLSRVRSPLIFCLLIVSASALAQPSEASPFDGMSAIDIAVAAALRKQERDAQVPSSLAEAPGATPSSITFFQCDIVELKGRFMHEGWYPIPGNPLPGTAATQVVLLGPWQTAEFRLIDEADDLLQELGLALDEEAPDGIIFLGTFDVPDQPFKMAVSGVDDQDVAYDVTCPKLFQPQTLEVRFDALFGLEKPGLIPLKLSITNHGPSGSFLLTVEDDMGVGASVDDEQVALDQDETIITTVHLNVPSISVGVLDITVTVTATGESEPERSNFGTTVVRVQKFNLIHDDGFEAPQSAAEESQ